MAQYPGGRVHGFQYEDARQRSRRDIDIAVPATVIVPGFEA
jgi:hypothetical protein